MDPLTRHIDRRFQMNDQIYVLRKNELASHIQRLRACFLPGILPAPKPEVDSAWNNVPNVMANALPLSMRTGPVFLRAPPPTPMEFSFSTAHNYPPSDGKPDDDWIFDDEADHPVRDAVEIQALEPSTESEGDSTSRYSYPEEPSDTQTDEEEELSRSVGGDSPSSSNCGSRPSSSRSSPMPVGFQAMVNQWLAVYHTRGTIAFLESLIVFATMSVSSAPLASRIARAVIGAVTWVSYREGKNLESAIRCAVFAAFKKHWVPDEASMSDSTEFPTPYGVNIAGFVGSLFDAQICEARDVYLCLSLLCQGERHLDRLCAMHALLVQANDKLCKSRNLPALMRFKEDITVSDGESGEFLWAMTTRSKMILGDILATIERWLLSQARKREQCQMSTSPRFIRRRTMGPRFLRASVEPHQL